MAEYNELEMKYMEEGDVDSTMLFREIKKLNDKVDQLDNKIEPKSEEELRADILAIKDHRKRQEAIKENIHLWKHMVAGGKYDK